MGSFLKKVSKNQLVFCAMSSQKKVKLDGIPFMTAIFTFGYPLTIKSVNQLANQNSLSVSKTVSFWLELNYSKISVVCSNLHVFSSSFGNMVET